MNFITKNNPLSILLNETDRLPSSISFHENLIKNYLQSTKLETILLVAFQSLFKPETLPKNPYFRLVRSLSVSNTQKEIIENFEKVINLFKKTQIKETKHYEIASIGDKHNVWGLPFLLEWVDPLRIEKMKFSLFEVLPDFESMIGEFKVHIVHSLGGGHILKSEILDNPDSASRPLEIAAEVFFTGDDLNEARHAFANYVFDDVVSLTNLKDLHLFRSFVLVDWNEEMKRVKKRTWNLKEMITKKDKFLMDVENQIMRKEGFYLRVLIKGKMIDFAKNLEDFSMGKPVEKKENYFASSEVETRFQYFDTFKLYNFHFIDEKNGTVKESYESQAMSSLLKRVFFTQESAFLYASFFYKPTESFMISKSFPIFIQKQLTFIDKDWKTQNMLTCAWNIFYLAILVQNDDLRKELTDNILQITSSNLASIISNCRINKILVSLLSSYQNSTLLFFRGVCLAYFEIYKQKLEKILASGKSSDIIRFRGYIFDRLKDLTEKKTGLLIMDSSAIEILKNLYNIMHGIAESELQIIAIFMSDFPDYIFETLKKNNLIVNKDLIMTFEEFINQKEPKFLIDISEEVNEMEEAGTYGSKDKKYLENLFIASYINEYEIFDSLYFFFRDIFFGAQIPNPFPGLISRMECQALKYDLFEINITHIKDVLLNPLNEDNYIKHNNKILKNICFYATNQMNSLKIPAVISTEKIVRITAAQEAGSLKLYLSNFDWKNSLTKSPPSTYQITDVFTVSGMSLLNNTLALKRAYIEWTVSWDFIFKGANIQNASQIFAFILIKYAIWLDQSTEVIVLGFFTNNDMTNPEFDMDFILKNLDNNKPRERLLSLFEGPNRIFMRIISRLEFRFKNILIYFNMVFLESESIKPQSLFKGNILENYIRVFFSPEDFVIWNKLFPFKVENVTSLLEENMKRNMRIGFLNTALKLKFIKLILEEADNVALTIGRCFFSLSESFFNFAKEAETLIFLFNHLESEKKIDETNRKLSLALIEPFFKDFSEKLREALMEYNNIYVEGIGMKIFYCLKELEFSFSKEYRLKSVFSKISSIKNNCNLISIKI